MTKHPLACAISFLVLIAVTGAAAADPRYTMKICKRDGPCAFVLDTETGEVRYCDPDGCRVLDAGEPVARPSPFPFAGQEQSPGQSPDSFPLGDMTAPETSVLEQLERPPSGGGPSPFPYVEPAPNAR